MMFFITVFSIIYAVNCCQLIKNKRWKELALSGCIFLLASAYALDTAMKLNIMPNPRLILDVTSLFASSLSTYFEIDQFLGG